MSFEEFQALCLPADSSLSLYGGIVVDEDRADRDEAMTKRGWLHARIEARTTQLLLNWLDGSGFAGFVGSGEVGCEDPASGLDAGIDVALFPETIVACVQETGFVRGLPVLAVEVISPSDQQSKIKLKVDAYLTAGIAVVWVVDPCFRTVAVHENGKPPVVASGDSPVGGGDFLPGFIAPASDFFR